MTYAVYVFNLSSLLFTLDSALQLISKQSQWQTNVLSVNWLSNSAIENLKKSNTAFWSLIDPLDINKIQRKKNSVETPSYLLIYLFFEHSFQNIDIDIDNPKVS